MRPHGPSGPRRSRGPRSKRPHGPVSCTREVVGGGPAASSVVSRALRGHEPTLVEPATGNGGGGGRGTVRWTWGGSGLRNPFLGGGLLRSVPRQWVAQAWSTIVPRAEVRSLTDAD